MKVRVVTGLLFTALPLLAQAQAAFNGTWTVDINKAQMPAEPEVYLLKDGYYECNRCGVKRVRADGVDHKIEGQALFDTMRITVVDDRTVDQLAKRDGQVVMKIRKTVSSDGKTTRFEFMNGSATDAEPAVGKGEMERVAPAPAGSHAISGSWRTVKLEGFSTNALTATYRYENGLFAMTTPTGQSYTAKLDGTDASYAGDPSVTTVSVRRIDANTIEETSKHEGKAVKIVRRTVSADGKSMHIAIDDLASKVKSEFIAERQ